MDSVYKLSLAAILVAASSASCDSASVEPPNDDGQADHADHIDVARGDGQDVSWMYARATWIGTLGEPYALTQRDELGLCQYTSSIAMHGDSDCRPGVTTPALKCGPDLGDTGFHKFSVRQTRGIDSLHVDVEHAEFRPTLCVNGTNFQDCASVLSTGSGHHAGIIVLDDDAANVRSIVVTSEESYDARTAVPLKVSPEYDVQVTFFSEKPAGAPCPENPFSS